ncbi:predicted protein [Botrytis cinerea T4]|uniref:Uncharacterized protein n=1 Tax=Botryotinia fuckeliana (strain T4) TaxID=999810 RepID=G2XYA5_BOTF4|nr:predicted protein [Botrytis cinerea T4]
MDNLRGNLGRDRSRHGTRHNSKSSRRSRRSVPRRDNRFVPQLTPQIIGSWSWVYLLNADFVPTLFMKLVCTPKLRTSKNLQKYFFSDIY